jgi:hypothetical protein
MVYAADTLLALVRAGGGRAAGRTVVRPENTRERPVQRPAVTLLVRPRRRSLAAR